MTSKNNDKLVVFESLGFSSIPAFYLYTKRNYSIKYFTIDPRLERSMWFQKLLTKYHANKIKWDDFDLDFNMKSHDQALNNVEKVYCTILKDSKLIHQMASLFNSEKIQLVYKKDLVENLEIFYHRYLCVNEIAEATKSITLISSDFTHFLKITGAELKPNVRIPLSSRVFNSAKSIVIKPFYLAALGFFPLWILGWKTRRIVLKRNPSKKYKNGFRVYGNDWGFLFKYRRVDFLLDEKSLTKDNSIFCVESKISDSYRKDLNSKYDVADVRATLHEIDLGFIKDNLIKKIIPTTVLSFFFSVFKPVYTIKTTIGILYYYMTWTMFTKKYNLNNYVVYTHFEKYHVVRNIIFSQNNIKTWYYVHSTHHFDVFENPQKNDTMRHVIYSYMYYDNLVSWGRKSNDIFTRCINYFAKFQTVGCLWSEHARMITDNGVISDTSKYAFAKFKTKDLKIIGVFDTTFGDQVPLQKGDMVPFLEGILRFLERNPDVGVIFKQKKIFEEMETLNPDNFDIYYKLYENLQSHERCYSTGRFGETCEVIAASDLVVSACFTSTTPEALGARKKAIFFDAADSFKGYYYDQFPKMVAHGFDDFESIVKYWLYEIGDIEFESYINTYVIPEIDAYADGKAITRFRELLNGEDT
ncbi:polysaccharide biosynthesis PFTS motif protein [Methanolobus psychrotolerans]|uniref:polysaccharide biosynthesis PFTS motif protein n=1 Tax=Methanolobus psychrotolerans TaxID=1874706 RepID=UPI0013EDA88A|nr:polysaccharide biosynthesis PFTS motif protein [Methanolobus psychrotolerans]